VLEKALSGKTCWPKGPFGGRRGLSVAASGQHVVAAPNPGL